MANNIVSQLIIKKAQELITSLTPTLAQLISDIGVKNIGQPDMMIPDTCLTDDKLEQIATIRNNIYDKVNTTANAIKRLSGPIDTLNRLVTTTSTALATVSALRRTTNAAIALIPPPASPPGAVISGLNTLKDLEEFLTPKIAIAQVSISTISLALDFANEILAKVMKIIDIVDQYLERCANVPPPDKNENLTKAINDYNQTLIPNTDNQIYKGFILEIVEEPYSPTVNRRQAVAKNSNGIILLKTPLSFTTDTQVLIEELKLVIDKNNLKAY
jgi:hypothetical protein